MESVTSSKTYKEGIKKVGPGSKFYYRCIFDPVPSSDLKCPKKYGVEIPPENSHDCSKTTDTVTVSQTQVKLSLNTTGVMMHQDASRDEMKLRSLKIRGFKSIMNSTIDLRDINIVIGPNCSGKSNLLSALNLLQNIMNQKLQRTVSKRDLPAPLYGDPLTTKELEMEFSFDRCSYGFALTPGDTENLEFVREYYGVDGRTRSVIRTIGGGESEFEKNTPDDVKPHVKPVLEAKKWEVYHFHNTTPVSEAKHVKMSSNDVFLHHDASNIAPFLYMLKQSHPKSYDDILSVIIMIAPHFEDFVLEPDSDNENLILLRWRQKGMN